ncbi:tripartite tricarboxylate transporter TctB family protein [Glaciimonas sp. GG7]
MRNFINKYNKDYYGGGLMIVLGLGAALQGQTYKIGTLSRMGPGFFPVALGILLVLIGAAIAIGAKNAIPKAEEKYLAPEWRGWLCISFSIVAFVILGTYGGLLPATFAIVFISALGDRKNTFKSALKLSLAMVAVCIVVFWWALKLQFPLFQWG